MLRAPHPLDFLWWHDLWTPFGCLISCKRRSIISVACDFTTKSDGIWKFPLAPSTPHPNCPSCRDQRPPHRHQSGRRSGTRELGDWHGITTHYATESVKSSATSAGKLHADWVKSVEFP